MFCREMVRDLRRARSDLPGFPKTILFFMGDVSEGARFFRGRWPEAHAVADPERVFFEGFGCRRARFRELFGLRALRAGLRALRKGNGIGKPVGDPVVMPGALLMRGDQVAWSHDFDHAGDHPDWAEVARMRDAACEPA
jgi:hypothetical protein